jgi:hypothetical protein
LSRIHCILKKFEEGQKLPLWSLGSMLENFFGDFLIELFSSSFLKICKNVIF